MYLDNSGQWQPAKTAVNPQTHEIMAFDGKSWQPVTVHGHGITSMLEDAKKAIQSGMYEQQDRSAVDKLLGIGGPRYQTWPERMVRGIGSEIENLMTAAGSAPPGSHELTSNLVEPSTNVAAAFLPTSPASAIGKTAAMAELPGTAATVTGARAAKNVAQHIVNPEARASAELQRAVQRDQGIAATVPVSRTNIATAVDVGGENVKGLLERVAQTPGAGRTTVIPFLTERQTKQLSRLSYDLKNLTGTSKSSLAAIDEQIATRSTNAAPLYAHAFEAGDNIIWSPELQRLTSAPEVQLAMRSAVSGWQRSQIAAGYGAAKPGAIVNKLAEHGGVEVSSPALKITGGRVPAYPNLQFWDYTKNALDDMIAAEIKPDGTITKKGRDLTIIVNKLRDQLDKSVPEYASARQAWGGPSAYINAINRGKTFTSSTSEEVSGALAKMGSEAEREAYRIGAVSQILTKMGGKSATLADITNLLRSPQMRGKISALMPDAQAAAKWHQALEFEIKSSDMVRRSLGNSATFRRLMEQQDSNIGVEMLMDLFKGKPPKGLFAQLFGKTLGAGYKFARDTLRSRTDAVLAKRLTQRLGQSGLQP